MLDGFNRYRFHHDPELIVAWQPAKRIVSGPQAKEAAATPLAAGLDPAQVGTRSDVREGFTCGQVAPLAVAGASLGRYRLQQDI
jgi:hypothetical protein